MSDTEKALLDACRLVSMFYGANPQLLTQDPRVRVYVEAARAAIAKAEASQHPECSICRSRHGYEVIHACE